MYLANTFLIRAGKKRIKGDVLQRVSTEEESKRGTFKIIEESGFHGEPNREKIGDRYRAL